jgi:2-polyprenyl-3-methyl-5-hydroxy-6-metoxy-1,4-benzoquinol methylase
MSKTSSTNDFRVYADAVRPEMLQFIPAGVRSVLEVGCSTGNFGMLLKSERHAEVWGVEMSEDAAKVASEKLDHVICGPFTDQLDLPRKRFDCIVFNDVLEHMVDPYAALALAKCLLADGGSVVASIPNVRYFGNLWALLYHKSWEYADSGILDRTHLRFFTKKSIVAMFSDLDYRIDSLTGINAVDKFDPDLVTRFRIVRLLTFNHIEDMRWLQFAIVARLAQN